MYLPDERGGTKLVNRTYLFSVLATFREEWLGTVLEEALGNRNKTAEDKKEEQIVIKQEILEELMKVPY